MSAENTAGKQRGRPFQKGQSGNPDGRPKGSRNATTIALETLLDGQATALTQKAIDVALTGDIPALRLCLDRILPPRKDSPVAFDLPEMKTLNDAVPAMGALVKAVGQGDLTPTEAGELTKMVQAFAKIIETAELEERVRKLEEAWHRPAVQASSGRDPPGRRRPNHPNSRCAERPAHPGLAQNQPVIITVPRY